jgi:hypothetical protein
LAPSGSIVKTLPLSQDAQDRSKANTTILKHLLPQSRAGEGRCLQKLPSTVGDPASYKFRQPSFWPQFEDSLAKQLSVPIGKMGKHQRHPSLWPGVRHTLKVRLPGTDKQTNGRDVSPIQDAHPAKQTDK